MILQSQSVQHEQFFQRDVYNPEDISQNDNIRLNWQKPEDCMLVGDYFIITSDQTNFFIHTFCMNQNYYYPLSIPTFHRTHSLQ